MTQLIPLVTVQIYPFISGSEVSIMWPMPASFTPSPNSSAGPFHLSSVLASLFRLPSQKGLIKPSCLCLARPLPSTCLDWQAIPLYESVYTYSRACTLISCSGWEKYSCPREKTDLPLAQLIPVQLRCTGLTKDIEGLPWKFTISFYVSTCQLSYSLLHQIQRSLWVQPQLFDSLFCWIHPPSMEPLIVHTLLELRSWVCVITMYL